MSYFQTKLEMASNGHNKGSVLNAYGIGKIRIFCVGWFICMKWALTLTLSAGFGCHSSISWWAELENKSFYVSTVKRKRGLKTTASKSFYAFNNSFIKETIKDKYWQYVHGHTSLVHASTGLNVFQSRMWCEIIQQYVITVCWKAGGTIHHEHHNIRHYWPQVSKISIWSYPFVFFSDTWYSTAQTGTLPISKISPHWQGYASGDH